MTSSRAGCGHYTPHSHWLLRKGFYQQRLLVVASHDKDRVFGTLLVTWASVTGSENPTQLFRDKKVPQIGGTDKVN